MGTADDRHPARIVLFDGLCNMCSAVARFVIRHDPEPGRFKLAALQSEAGQRLLRLHSLSTDALDTFVLIEEDRAFVRSTAALRLVRGLGLPWSLLYGFIIVPRPWRDAAYRWVARKRYAWFGRRETCMMPSDESRHRFLL